MKRLFTIMIAVLLAASLFAQAPQKMSYQAVIRNTSNQLVKTQVGMRISILRGSPSGTVSYMETQTPTPNENGLVSIEIGGGEGFDTINWASESYYIMTETDPDITGGLTDYTITGVSQLLSVPYALYAKTAETATETDPDVVLLTGDQTISGNKTFSGTTTVITPVNATDAATKAYVDALKIIIYDELLEIGINGVVKDIEGNAYKTIKIGNQVWMAENLKTNHYANGDAIPDGTGIGDYSGETNPIYWFVYDDDLNNVSSYGRLYTWYAITGSQNICPDGWHVPTNDEWTVLENFMIDNGYNYDGTTSGNKIAKSLASTNSWSSSSIVGVVGNTDYSEYRNKSGFTALSAGYRNFLMGFQHLSLRAYFWSITENGDGSTAWYRIMYYDNISLMQSDGGYKNNAFSVRCIRD